jgi:DNA-binding CsgD family transcriptional regulator
MNMPKDNIPKVRVRKVRKGVGVLEIPVHMSDGPTRLPAREADYLAPSLPNGRVETEQEAQVKRWYRDGLTVERIAVNSGIRLESIYSILNLDMTTKEFEQTKAKIEARKRI